MCKFCDDYEVNGRPTEYLVDEDICLNGIPVLHCGLYIDPGDDEPPYMYYYVENIGYEDDVISEHIDINYCPMCGKKLNNKEDS
jgi:hypothetical protein